MIKMVKTLKLGPLKIKTTNAQVGLSIIIALIFTLVIFFIIQGLFVDSIDNIANQDLQSAAVRGLTILNFMVLAFSYILFLSFMMSAIFFIKGKNLFVVLGLSIAFTLIVIWVVSYIAIKSRFAGIGIQYFLVAPGLFIVFVLQQSTIIFFMIELGIFLFFFIVMLYIF